HYQLSLADNVALGPAGTAEEKDRLHDALVRAGALSFADALPHGIGTVLSKQYARGTELSGGQWQRVAIARAIYALTQGATVLVLDEPTASLDVRAEAAFFSQFLDITRGATTVLISHRFSTVRKAQRIVVLESGRVVEDGA